MSKVILVCGKICSGKTYYCNKLKEKNNAVLLSCDEILSDLFHHNEGDKHDEIVKDIKEYLHKKSVEIIETGCDVILDWGFWSNSERKAVTEFYNSKTIISEWHYIDINSDDWLNNINERNQKVISGICSDYYVDEGLIDKLMTQFDAPTKDEIFCWYHFKRD